MAAIAITLGFLPLALVVAILAGCLAHVCRDKSKKPGKGTRYK